MDRQKRLLKCWRRLNPAQKRELAGAVLSSVPTVSQYANQKARKASSFMAEMDSADGKAVLMGCKMHHYFMAVYIASFVMT